MGSTNTDTLVALLLMIGLSLFEGVVYAGVLHQFFMHKFKRYRYRFYIMGSLTSGLLIGSALLEMPFLVKSLLVFLLLIPVASFIYKASAYKVIFITMAVFYINLIAELVVGNVLSGIFHQSISELMDSVTWMYILSGCITHLLQLSFAILLNQYFKRVIFNNPIKYWVLLDLILAFSYLITALFVQVNPVLQTLYSPFIILMAVIAFVSINGIVVFLFSQMSKQAQREKQTMLIEAMAEETVRDMKKNRRMQEEFHRISHEWKNYNAALSFDLSSGNIKGAIERIRTAGLRIPPDELRKYTGNDVIDYVLNGKIALATKKGIKIEPDCAAVVVLPIEPSEIISVISNLLDNAIEAVELLKEPERIIKFECKCNVTYLMITLQNPYTHDVVSEGGRLISSKSDAALHGYGITIARDICEKYSGNLHISRDNGVFTARASFRI